MRFDTVLGPADASNLQTEVAGLRRRQRRLARGVSTGLRESDRPYQFQAFVDEEERSWTFDRQGSSHRAHYSEGHLHSEDGSFEVSFERSGNVAPPVRLLTPELLPLWGSPASYSPMLVQRIQAHWLLFTFEHELDPAQRVTLVVGERDGIAHRSYGQNHTTVLTEVRVLDDEEPAPARPKFSRRQEWPRLEY